MSTRTAFDRLAELDRRNVVDVDLGSDEFKANAHRHMAEWARRPPFYVLGKGRRRSWSAATPTCTGLFRHRDLRLRDAEGPGWEQFHKFMDAQFVTQMDGSSMPAFAAC